MIVGLIGAGGQVADAVASLATMNGHRVLHHRPKRLGVSGVPVRPRPEQNRLDVLEMTASDAAAAGSLSLRRHFASASELKSADVLIYALPAYTVESAAAEVGHACNGRPLINLSDRFLGTAALVNALGRSGSTPAFTVSLSSPPFLAYRGKGHVVRLHARKRVVAAHVDPHSHADTAVSILGSLGLAPSEGFAWKRTLLELAFESTQSILHCVQDVANIRYGLYSRMPTLLYGPHRFTDDMVQRIDSVVAERGRIAKCLGVADGRSLSALNATSFGLESGSAPDTAGFRRNHAVLGGIPTPPWQSAHGFEDVGWALVPLETLGRRLAVPTPCLSALVDEWSATFAVDYRRIGRQVADQTYWPHLCDHIQESWRIAPHDAD